MMTLSVVICTCNREQELLFCVASVLESIRSTHFLRVDLLIVDDGELPDSTQNWLSLTSASVGVGFLYYRKSIKGLYASRLEAIGRTTGDIILFLDDDVVVEPDYLSVLEAAFADTKVGGFSGIDVSLNHASWRMLLYQFLFLHCSTRLGKLSLTGFNGAVTRWPGRREPFYSEFFLGFNMAFRRALIVDLPHIDVFRGYSVGEDLFISRFASSYRYRLVVNPAGRLIHHRSPAGRDNARCVARSVVSNQFFLLGYFFPDSLVRRALFMWSAIGLAVKGVYDWFFLFTKRRASERRAKMEEVKGTVDGLLGLISRRKIFGTSEVKSACQP
jgi:glycosyltransferase involved in cell wall biosynthesis